MSLRKFYRVGTGIQSLEDRKLMAAAALEAVIQAADTKPAFVSETRISLTQDLDLKKQLDTDAMQEDLTGMIDKIVLDEAKGKLSDLDTQIDFDRGGLSVNVGQDNGKPAPDSEEDDAEFEARIYGDSINEKAEIAEDEEDGQRFFGERSARVIINEAEKAADAASQTDENGQDAGTNGGESGSDSDSDETDDSSGDSNSEMPNPEGNGGDGNEPIGSPTDGDDKSKAGRTSETTEVLLRNDLTRDPAENDGGKKEPAPNVGSNNGGLVTNPSPESSSADAGKGIVLTPISVDVVFHNIIGTMDPLPGGPLF
ncbi:hypothetical protein [Stieleria varia]|uniref:Uncharacterized protein n=1 Tax=Stieleria varia TaxID=2528005 RepID=A0A5C6A1W7_9BACT|nr:hypothetical protein [Stieleria varia]TWT93844.1 hypothetical protein Pla52n_56720 [Stieleria varia]